MNSTLDLFVDGNFTIVTNTTPAGLNVTYIPDNSGVVSVDANGTVTALKEGNATIIVKVGDGKVYALNSTNVTVTVSKIPTEINVQNDTIEMAVGDKIEAAVNITPSDAGELDYTSSDVSVVTVNSIGEITAVANGTANITISFAGNDKYAAAENKTITVTVRKAAEVNITADDITVGDNLTIDVTLPEDATGNVSAVVGNTTYTANVTNGSASLAIPDLAIGNYTIPVTYSGDEAYASVTQEINATVNDIPDIVIIASDIEKYFGGNESLIVNVTDKLGNPLDNMTVIISLNGKNYTRTSKNGTCNPVNIGMSPGKYVANITAGNFSKEVNIIVKSNINATDV